MQSMKPAAPAAPAADAGGGDEPAAASSQEESYLAWMYKALGLFYSFVFLALSFTLVALLVMNLLTARRFLTRLSGL